MFTRKLFFFSVVIAITVSMTFWVRVSFGQSPRDWAHIQTQDAPSPRFWFAMDYDPVRDRVVVFGGSLGGGVAHSDETWEYDGSNWELIEALDSPPPLRLPYMVYFPPLNGMILFGGYAYPPGEGVNDTWLYDGTNWTKLSPPQSPGVRSGHSMAYDEQRGVIVLFGGQGPDRFRNDTWEFDGNTWIEKTPLASPTVVNGPRRNTAMTYDKARGKIVLYGGGDETNRFNDTWEYDGVTWEKINTPVSPDIPRNQASITYLDSEEVIVLFGGHDSPSGTPILSQDTWIYDGTTWTKFSTPTTPPARTSTELVYRPATDAVILFGGWNNSSSVIFDDTWELVLVNQPPIVDAGGPYDGNEGSPIPLNGSASDPDNDPLTTTWTVDSPLCTFADPTVLTTTLTCADNGTFTSTLTVDDGVNEPISDPATVTVYNVAPAIDSISIPLDPVEVGVEINASADFTDIGILDTHTAEWDWGDNSTSTGIVTEANGSGSVTGNHVYAEAGVYTVKLTVTDDDGDSDEAIFQYVVVYDPDDGFVTGGGWINSPVGAYVPDPSLTGPASFGFVSKYKKGASVPTGQTEFQFKVADLNFHSSTYEWLVVAGPTAKFKGTGTINGAGNYGFMITATDEKLTPSTDVDLFRVKIWDKDNGDLVVYDNKMGEDDDSDAGTALEGGNIVIHKAK